MTHPLIQRLHDDYGYPTVTVGSHDDFVTGPGVAVLFFAGDPKRHKETTDVAVVLPELIGAFEGRLRPGVVAEADEKTLQVRYGVRTWPALVFLRDGGYLGTITRIRNWTDYLERIQRLMTAATGEPPDMSASVPVRGPAARPASGDDHEAT